MRVCACARVSRMTGKCLLCGFDLGANAEGNKRTGSHSQRTCALKSYPCLHGLPPTHPFHKADTCYLKDCACLEKCSKCRVVGHRVGTMVLSPGRFVMDGRTGNITRRRGAPPLTKSDFACTWLQESDVAEWVRVQHAACWQEWREAQELAASAARLAANVHEAGWDVIEAADVMEASGVAAATNGVENRAHFESMVAAADETGQTAVGAALMAATGGATAIVREGGVRVGRGGRGAAAGRGRIGRGGRGAGATSGGSGRGRGTAAEALTAAVRQRGAAAAANHAPLSPEGGNEAADVNAAPSRPSGESAWDRRVRGRGDVRGGRVGRGSRIGASSSTIQSGRAPAGVAAGGSAGSSDCGGGSSVLPEGGTGGRSLEETGSRSAAQMQRVHTGLMHANAMRAADGVSRLLATGAGSTDGVRFGAAAAARAGVREDAPAVPAPPFDTAPPFHLRWKAGERRKYEGVVTFECPAISALSPEELARKVFRGALGVQAAVFPAMGQEFIQAATDNFLIGMSITCGVVSPADVAEQLVSRRTMFSNTNLLSLIGCWVKKYIDSNVAASQVLGVSLGGEATWDSELATASGARVQRRGSARGREGGSGGGDEEDNDDDEEGPGGSDGSDIVDLGEEDGGGN